MMSIRALGNLSTSGQSAKAAAHYYNEISNDYYSKDEQEKENGKWIGSGAERQGLSGPSTREELQLALSGSFGNKAVQNAGMANRQIGWDMTLSAPKSVSLAWAFADPELRAKIEAAHQKAVEAVFRYMEPNIHTRRGSGGTIKEQAHTFAVSFTHYTSRANDPQLHTHIVLPNLAWREDGTVGTIESKTCYDYRMAGGHLYQTELAYEMRKLGFEIENDKKGTFRLKEVDKQLEKLFSKRDAQINKMVEERGITTYAGSRKMVLATRPDKIPYSITERKEFWHNEAKAAGLSTETKYSQQPLTPEKIDTKAIANTISGKMVKGNSTFKEKDIMRNIAADNLGNIDVEGAKQIFDEAKQQDKIIAIGTDKFGNTVYSTPEMIGLEKEMLARIENMAAKEKYGVDTKAAIEHCPHLTQEQRTAIESACGKGSIAVIQGRAGTGKTTMLSVVKEAYEKEGYKVQGIAFTGQAAQNLEQATGIKSQTIASWQKGQDPENEFNQDQKIDNKTVLVLDEAGMIGSRPMSEILEKADQANAKIILVGDERQLQPIEAGGALKAVDQKLAQIKPEASSRMEDIKRQHEAWMRQTVKEAAQGHTKEALKELDKHGKIEIYNSPQEARSKLVNDYIKENTENQKDGIILTNHKADAAKINQEVREKLQEQGKIKENRLEVDNGSRKITLAEGDRVMFTRNDYQIDVRNGQRGTVSEIDEKNKTIKVEMDNKQDKTIDTEKYNHIEYGWASTTHKSQGATAEKAYVYGHTQEPMASQQSTYVQISRAKEETKIYAVNGERSIERPWQQEQSGKENSLVTGGRERNDAMNELERSWGKDSAKETTLDYSLQKEITPEKDIAQEKEITKHKENEKDFGLEMGM